MTCTDDAGAFKHRDATSYDPVADAFDRWTQRYSMELACRVVDLARLVGSEHILDIGTGTGVVAIEAARRLEGSGHVLGIDLSEGMLLRAAGNSAAAGVARQVDFRRMDAETLELPDQSFDAVVSLFALLHFPQPEKALKEMYRVLRPGGRLVIAVGSGPPPWSLQGWIEAVRRSRAWVQRWRGVRLEAPRFLDRLVTRYIPAGAEPEEAQLARAHRNRAGAIPRLVRSAGFQQIRRSWRAYEREVQAPADFWELQATFSSLARKRLFDASTEEAGIVRQQFCRESERVLGRGGKLIYPFAAVFVTAARPAAPRSQP